MAALQDEVRVMEDGEDGGGHGIKGSHRNLPPVPQRYRPGQVGVVYNDGGVWRRKAV